MLGLQNVLSTHVVVSVQHLKTFSLCRQCWDMCKNSFLFFQRGPPKHKKIILTPLPTRRSILRSETPPNQPCSSRPRHASICVFARHLGHKGIQTEGKAGMVDRWLGQRSSDMRAAWKTKAISTFHTAWGFHRDERNTVAVSWTWSRAAHKQSVGEFTALVICASTATEEGTKKLLIWNIRDILGSLSSMFQILFLLSEISRKINCL